MATYTIIGGDGKEYGPISADDIHKWLAEGRLNAQSLMKAEGDTEFRPLEKFPEFAGAIHGHAPGTMAPLPSSVSLDGDYQIEISDCVSCGFELVKKNFGTLFLTGLVFLAIQIAVSLVLNMTLVTVLTKTFHSAPASIAIGFLIVILDSLAFGPLFGGFFLVYLKTIRGEATNVGEIFVGFQKAYSQLVLGLLIVNLVSTVCLLPFNYVLAEKLNPLTQQLQQLQTQHAAPAEMTSIMSQMYPAVAGTLPVLLVCLIPWIYLMVCFQFTVPLIMDKQLSFGAAIKLSWQRVNQHWWQVFGLTFLAVLLLIAGGIACCIGLLFTLPISTTASLYAYEVIFNGRKERK